MATDLAQQFCALRDTYIEKQFGRLNDMQREAVFTTNGPLLISRVQAAARPPCWSTASPTSSASARPTLQVDAPGGDGGRCESLRTAIMTGTDAPSWLDGMLRKDAVRSWNVMAITFTNKAPVS